MPYSAKNSWWRLYVSVSQWSLTAGIRCSANLGIVLNVNGQADLSAATSKQIVQAGGHGRGSVGRWRLSTLLSSPMLNVALTFVPAGDDDRQTVFSA